MVLATWTTTLWNHEMLPLQWGVVIGASLVAAAFDVASRRIPNLLTGPLFLAGLAWACAIGGLAGLADSLMACLILALPYILLFIFAGGGAGDAKLMGAIGAWLGLLSGAITLAAVCVSGVVLALLFALAKKRFHETLRNVAQIVQAALVVLYSKGKLRDFNGAGPKTETMQTLPYGVAICSGVLIAAAGVLSWSV